MYMYAITNTISELGDKGACRRMDAQCRSSASTDRGASRVRISISCDVHMSTDNAPNRQRQRGREILVVEHMQQAPYDGEDDENERGVPCAPHRLVDRCCQNDQLPNGLSHARSAWIGSSPHRTRPTCPFWRLILIVAMESKKRITNVDATSRRVLVVITHHQFAWETGGSERIVWTETE